MLSLSLGTVTACHSPPPCLLGHSHTSVVAHWRHALAHSLWVLKFCFGIDLKNGLIGSVFSMLFWALFLGHRGTIYLDHSVPSQLWGGVGWCYFWKFFNSTFFLLVLIATTISHLFHEFEFLGQRAGTGLGQEPGGIWPEMANQSNQISSWYCQLIQSGSENSRCIDILQNGNRLNSNISIITD